MDSHNIKLGEYIIIQRQNYKKLHKFNNASSCVSLGKDNIELSAVQGCPFNTVFKMIPKSRKNNKLYTLELTKEAVGLKEEINIKVSGMDNRNIIDDGRSQKLSASEIEELQCDTNSASDIVGTLISNSNTFHSKTEFSQDKYLRKKETKYFKYIQIRKPNLRLITEIMYRLDPNKIQGIRMDTLSQIMTYSNVQATGNHLLYDSGSNGLLAAALLSIIGGDTKGKLIHMHPGNMSQKQALLAMNFEQEQYSRCISVNIYSALRQYYQGCDVHKDTESQDSSKAENNANESSKNDNKRKVENEDEPEAKIPKLDIQFDTDSQDGGAKNGSFVGLSEPKKPKWHFDNIAAAEILAEKMDSLVIACKEDPANIFNELISFIKPGRPFLIYYTVAEPLHQLYLTLKSRHNVAALKLTCNWMRNYQVNILVF